MFPAVMAQAGLAAAPAGPAARVSAMLAALTVASAAMPISGPDRARVPGAPGCGRQDAGAFASPE